MPSAAELFVRCLENEGVEYVFGIPGEETLDLNEALEHSESIQFLPVRHEQGAAFMADAYGRLTGRAGVCLGTLGPGATNLVTGLADAYLDRAPVVALTGPDRPLGDAQGEPPVHRHRPDDEAGDEVERPHPRPGDHPRGGAQGLRPRRAREARRDPPRAARRRHGGRGHGARRCRAGRRRSSSRSRPSSTAPPSSSSRASARSSSPGTASSASRPRRRCAASVSRPA